MIRCEVGETLRLWASPSGAWQTAHEQTAREWRAGGLTIREVAYLRVGSPAEAEAIAGRCGGRAVSHMDDLALPVGWYVATRGTL